MFLKFLEMLIKSNKNFYMKNKDLDISIIKQELVKYYKDIVKDSRDKDKSEK